MNQLQEMAEGDLLQDDSSRRSERGYDQLARRYRLLEMIMFGNDLQRARTSLLDRIPDEGRALVLGDGDGRFLQQFHHAKPGWDFLSIDQSSAMLRLQKERLPSLSDDCFQQAELRSWRPNAGSFDLLVTCFFLDCFSETDLTALLPRWLRGLRRGGLFYLVDFQHPSRGWRRVRASCYLSAMHHFFRWQTGLSNHRLVDLSALVDRFPLDQLDSAESSQNLIAARLYRPSRPAPRIRGRVESQREVVRFAAGGYRTTRLTATMI